MVYRLLYRLLLPAFPAAIRHRHGEDMAQLFADRCREARRGVSAPRGILRVAGLSLLAVRDALGQGLAARMGASTTRGSAGAEPADGRGGSLPVGGGAPNPAPRRPATSYLADLAYDLRYTIRDLLTSRSFPSVAVGSLAIGIGASTAIFTLVNALILRPLPVAAPHELVQLTTVDTGITTQNLTNPQWEALRDRGADEFDGLFAVGTRYFRVGDEEDPIRTRGLLVSGSLFSTLGLQPAVGRLIEAGDDVRGCPGIAVLDHGYWQSRYGGDPAVVGRTIRLRGHPFEIVGVAPQTFHGLTVEAVDSIYAPICSEAVLNGESSILDARRTWAFRAVGRLRQGTGMPEARAQLDALGPAVLADAVPLNYGAESRAEYLSGRFEMAPFATGFSSLRDQYERPLMVLLGAVTVVMLIVCSNLANLLLARTARRRPEIAMRVALGAGHGRLLRQFLTESLLLAGAGALGGVAVAFGISRGLVSLIAPADGSLALDLSLDLRVLGFTTAAALAAGLLFGIGPALHAARTDPNATMRGRAGGGAPSWRRGGSLVAAQVGMSLVLLSGAALLVGTFWRLETLDPGFARDRVLLLDVEIRDPLEPEPLRQTFVDLTDRLRAVPGVEAASYAELTPISGNAISEFVVPTGYESLLDEDVEVLVHRVGEDYFAAIGSPLLFGREFSDDDVEGSEPVAILSESAARGLFGEADVVGRRFHRRMSDTEVGEPILVVGVARDAVYRSLREQDTATAYFALRQQPARFFGGTVTYHVLPVPGAAPLPGLQAAAEDVAGNVRMSASPLSAQLSASLARERLLATISAAFGLLALFLAVLGLYGVMSFNVVRRFPEIGVRLALGSSVGAVFGLVLRQAAWPVAAGLGLGALGTAGAAGTVESLVYGVDPYDARILVGCAVVLALAATASAALPARRAARLDPLVVLRRDE